MTRRLVLLPAAHHETLVAVVFNVHTEGLHQMQRDIDIRFGNQLTFDGDGGVLRCQRCRHQQRGEELARDAAVYRHVTTGKATTQAQRRIVFLLQIINLCAALTQRVHQMANRTLFHARFTRQHDVVATQTQRRRQRAHCRTGISEEQFQRVSGLQCPGIAGDFAAGAIGRQGIVDSQRFQRIEHMANVIAVQQVSENSGAVCQRCQQQGAVRDTF